MLTPREAARLLGISYPTIKQWILTGKLKTVTTPGGHHRIAVTAIITANAVRELALKPGDAVAALIKSTDVMIERLDTAGPA